MDEAAGATCRAILNGYRHAVVPDLSNSRRRDPRGDILQEAVISFDASTTFSSPAAHLDALVLVAYAYVLGLYSGITDVLVGLVTSSGSDPFPLRLQWDDQTTWASAVRSALTAIDDGGRLQIPINLIQQNLELKSDECPFLAFFRRSQYRGQEAGTSAPLLAYLPEDSCLVLVATVNRIHPSIATTLLHQIVSIVSLVYTDQSAKMATPFRLTDELSSVLEVPMHSGPAYSHISPVRIVTDFILPHVESTPNAPAVYWYPSLPCQPGEDNITPECLTYSELHKGSNRFARFLLRLGLLPEDRVAVCMDRNLMFHFVLFGILRAGGCYVPIDPELPKERKLYIAKDSNARFVVTSSQLSGIFGDTAVDVDDASIKEVIASMNEADLMVPSPVHLAYMLYTSGTTGNPKGCLLTHEGLSGAILALSSFAADVRMEDVRQGRYLAIASIAFDVHLAEVFMSLSLGMSIICARRSELLENLPHYICRLEITHVGLVPSLIDATMCAAESDEMSDKLQLKFIASGGEKISDTILDKWGDHPTVKLGNFYGPSEVTIGCCARFVDSNTPKGNVGRPFANVSSYVVDQYLNILPRGALGELIVAGPLVGRGYHGLPDLTAKGFLEWPKPGSWAYRTGDLARMLPDGTVEIVGRFDTQIKLRGVRIEVEGIAAVLRQAGLRSLGHTLDVETTLAFHPRIGGGNAPQLVSFVAWDNAVPVVTRRGIKPYIVPFLEGLLEALRSSCERELASYMRPAHIIPLSWLPLNHNGKTDSKVLAKIFQEAELDTIINLGRPLRIPAILDSSPSDIVHNLVSLLSKRIRVQPSCIDLSTNLFGYGMDSLSLAQFAFDVRRKFNVTISVADIMKIPSLAAISAFVSSTSPSTTRRLEYIENFSEKWLPLVQSAVAPMRIERILPPFPIQQGVLYLSDSRPGSCVQHVIMSVSHTVSILRLYDAWHSVMKKLDILRTVFFFGRELVQVIFPPDECCLPWSEKHLSDEQDDTFCASFLADDATSLAADINRASNIIPLFRLTAYKQPEKQRLVLSIHHSLFDGISLPLILKFVEDELFDKHSEFNHRSDELLEYIHRPDADNARDFWTSKFDDIEWSTFNLIDVPLHSRPCKKIVPVVKPLSVIQGLVARHNVTLQAALMCTFATLLSRHIYGRGDVVFGVIRSGRLLPIDRAQRAPYPMLTVLPFRVNLSLEGCLQHIQEDISAAVSFEHLPLSRVQNWIRPGQALFDALFAVTVKEEMEFRAWDILHSDLSRPDFPLSVEVLLDGKNDALIVRAAYYEVGHLTSTLEHMLEEFEAVLFDVLEHGTVAVEATTQGNAYQIGHFQKVIETDVIKEDEVTTLDLEPLQEAISQFLEVPREEVHPSVSLLSLGLDSIRALGLSKLLRQHGYAMTATDILKHPSLKQLSTFIDSSRPNSREINDTSQEFLRREQGKIGKYVDLSTYKLSIDDEVSLFPTTALQSGILSQVCIFIFTLFKNLMGYEDYLSRLHKAWDLVCLGQAVWAKFLVTLTSSLDIVFGHVVAGRAFEDAEDVIGPMLNTIPFRVEIVPGMSNLDLLQQIHKENLKALSWQHVSLRAVQKEMGLEGLFHSLFLFQPTTSLFDSKIWNVHNAEEFDAHIQYPINVEFSTIQNGHLIKMVCLSTIMDSQTMDASMERLQDMFIEMVHHPERTATSYIPATSPEEESFGASPDLQLACESSSPIPPALADILSSITGYPPEGLDSTQSLSSIGIDSITSIAVAAKCRAVGLGITVTDIISSRTISELVWKDSSAAAVAPVDATDAQSSQVSPEEYRNVVSRFPREVHPRIISVSPTTAGMQWLIGAWQTSQQRRFQHVFAYEVSDSIAHDIRNAWKAFVAYHPILRSTFACAPGSTEPRIVTFSEDLEIPLEVEVEGSSGDPLCLADRMKTIISSPLAIKDPQTRGILLVSQNKTYLLLRMHHFQYDAFSIQLLLHDLALLCQGFAPTSSRDIDGFLKSFAPSSTHISEQMAYWQSAFPTPVVPDYFPTLIPRGARPAPQRTIVTVKTAVQGVKALEHLTRSLDLSLYAALLSCWASVHAHYTSCDRVVFGLWHAGRTGSVQNIDELAIPCMNVLPIHAIVSDDLFQTALRLQENLRKRTAVIQQTKLEDIHAWVAQGTELPLTNVFVNVFRISQATSDTRFFNAVEVDYYVPESVTIVPDHESVIDELPIARLIKDDVMIDIVINEQLDVFTMSVESAPEIMGEDHAMELIKTWSATVERFLLSTTDDA
ncbi:hypothetical protein ID866_2678 [Astraeus odoratus]|nr:hypothetical protein ID866_2678 [Astraeus odoratus]